MKSLQKAIMCLLLAGLIPALGACTETPTPGSGTQTEERDTAGSATTDTEAGTSSEASTEEQAEKPPRDVYEDLSFDIPSYPNPDEKTVTVQSEGTKASGQVHLDFTALNGQYILSSTKIGFSCHDVVTCDTCGYVDTNDGGAYLISSHGKDQGGITVTVAAPILASSVTGMTLTFRTTAEAAASSMRILSAGQTNNAAFINSCAPMGGATQQWTTVDLGVKDFSELADDDGYIRSFQMYFRNKSNTDCYVQSVDFSISPDEFLTVEETVGNCFFRYGAVESIAHIIAGRFTAADIQAEISVTGSAYRKNSSSSDGSLRYTATATLSDGTVIRKECTAAVPAVSGVWLDTSNSQYGSSHDNKGQWQDTFDPSGLLFLTDNSLSCTEGVKTVEYAVVAKDLAYDDGQIVWRAPHLLEMNGDGISHMLVNAFLDLGDQLTEGESYRFLVRGVTKESNYILHIDIPFVYQALSTRAATALQTAQAALAQADFTCSADVENKANYVRDQLTSLIRDEAIAMDVEILGEGLGSLRACVSLRYSPAITEARLPVYELDGKIISDVYNYVGQAFTQEALTVYYSHEQTAITLLTPFDGDRRVILAADVIYDHAKAPLAMIQNVNYGYLKGEYCTPKPVTLTWADEHAAEGKSYTVYLSRNRDMTDATEITVTHPCAEIYNLNIGTTYYWQVKSEDGVSPVQVFTTEDGYPRFIKLDGVSNVRDIGGYITTDGRRVKQNLAYRSAQLESITDDAREIALRQLNIRTDLDLRGGSTSPLGSSVKHISVAMQWYEHIFEEDMYGAVKKTVSAFADEKNYPIIFHCSMGRDRTGTTAFLILGLLGVDEDTLRHEYYASFFSQQGAFNESEFPLLIANVDRLVKGLADFGDKDDTLQEKIRAYLLHIGVTEAELRSICDIWLE